MCYTDRGGGVLSKSNLGITNNKKNCIPQNTRPQAWINQKNLQINFLEAENKNLKKSFRNLEQNLKINKEMLSVVLADVPSKDNAALLRLNNENQELLKELDQIARERDDLLASQLIG